MHCVSGAASRRASRAAAAVLGVRVDGDDDVRTTIRDIPSLVRTRSGSTVCSQPLRAPRVTVWHASRSSASGCRAPDAAPHRRASPRRRSRNGDRHSSLRRGARAMGPPRPRRSSRRSEREPAPIPPAPRPAAVPAARLHRCAGGVDRLPASGRAAFAPVPGAPVPPAPAAQGAGARASAEPGAGGRGSALAEESSAPADGASGGRGARSPPPSSTAEGRCATAPCDQSGREARAEARPAPGDPAGEGPPIKPGPETCPGRVPIPEIEPSGVGGV